MRRLRWFSGLLAAFFAVSVGHAQVGAPVAGASGPPSGTYTQAQQLAAARTLGIPYVLAKSGLAFIYPSSGSMGNNGAITALTALGRTYGNAYIYMPAGAVAAGVPAAGTWYFAQCSSTTACTVFNNIYTSGVPTIPASPTPFATTGPGAFTGPTGEVGGTSVTVPPNSIGANGLLKVTTSWEWTNSANNKTPTIKLNGTGGSQMYAANFTTTAEISLVTLIQNRGVTNSQITYSQFQGSLGGIGEPSANAKGTGSIDTTASLTIDVNPNKANAADNLVIDGFMHEVISDGT